MGIIEEAIHKRLEDNVKYSTNSFNTSNNSKPYDGCRKQPESFYGVTGISTNIESLTASKVSILLELCKTEHCHCMCLQETHRSINLTTEMLLVAERSNNKYGSAILI